jgi:TetR/AcrR family transcriptional regulator
MALNAQRTDHAPSPTGRRGSWRTPGALRRPATAQRILAAAEHEFAEHGIEGARTDQIVRAAGVNKALLYYYFGSKEKLYAAVLESLFSQQRATIDAARGPASLPRHSAPHQRELIAFVNGYFDFVIAHPNFPRLVQRELMNRRAQLRGIVRSNVLPKYRDLVHSIEGGIATGEFRDVDAPNMVATLIAITVFYFAAAPVLKIVWGRDPLTPRAIAARRRAVLDFLEHGLFRPSARKQ